MKTTESSENPRNRNVLGWGITVILKLVACLYERRGSSGTHTHREHNGSMPATLAGDTPTENPRPHVKPSDV